MKFLCKISVLFSLFSIFGLEAKVNIFAHYFGQPEFVKYQHLFFQKNMLDEYEFFVFEDSSDPLVSEQIKNECQKYGITYIHIPISVFNNPKFSPGSPYVNRYDPSFGCAVATQYIYDNYVVPSEDICVVLDNDIFLVSPFSVERYMGSKAFAYVDQERSNHLASVHYMLPNFLIFNPVIMLEKESLNFNFGTISGNDTDSGGFTHFYLVNHGSSGKTVPKYYLFDTPSELKDRYQSGSPLLFTSQEWSSHSFIDKDLFLHIRMGSNWSKHKNYLQIRRDIETLFNSLLDN